MVQALLRRICQHLRKLQMHLSFGPIVPFLVAYHKYTSVSKQKVFAYICRINQWKVDEILIKIVLIRE